MAKHAGGRPTKFTPELGKEICYRMMTLPLPDNSLRNICKDEKMPHRNTVRNWLLEAVEENARSELKVFLCQYDIAVDVRLENMHDEAYDIAFDESGDLISNDNGLHGNSTKVARDKTKIDLIKWSLMRLKSEKYGDKTETVHSGSIDVNPAAAFLDALRDG